MRNLFGPGSAALVLLAIWGQGARAETVLTIDRVRELAVQNNRGYLTAQQEVLKAESQIVTARADAFPDISLHGSYDRNLKIPSFFVQSDTTSLEFRTGYNHSFGLSASLRQTLWDGGKVFSAMSISRLYKQYALDIQAAARAQVVNAGEVLFYQAILARSRVAVMQKALETADHNLSMVEMLHDKGVVSQFELLRARVEKANLQPGLINAESEVRLAEQRLKSFLGIGLADSVTLAADPSDTILVTLPPVKTLIDTALFLRPEVGQADHLASITRKAIWVAKSEYSPSLDAVASYNWSGQSDQFKLDEHESRSAAAGLRLTIPIFKGFRQSGQIAYRKADYNEARLHAAQVRDDVALEVESAYDRLIQAKKSLDVQGETIAQAEEGLKIADVRYQSGVGTQLEVLSAQTALTQARTALAEALFGFRAARSALKKATTLEIL